MFPDSRKRRLTDAELAKYATRAIEELETRAGDHAEGGARAAILAELETAREALERLDKLVQRREAPAP
jgi:hypothetical protein